MDKLVLIGILAVAAVLIIGTAIKLYTGGKLKDFEGTYDSAYDMKPETKSDTKKVDK